jgi:hypothetical protein
MRTEWWKLSGRPLALLTLSLGVALAAPPRGGAQQTPPDLPEPPAVELAEPAELPDAQEAPPMDFGDGEDRVSILGGSRTIREGESVRDVLVIGGNLRVYGEVRGDAVVVGGNLRLYPTGRIRGDVVIAGGRFHNEGGEISGELRTVNRGAVAGEGTHREVRRERRESSFGRIGRGMAGIASTLALVVVLGAVGAGLVFYGHRHLETVSDTLRASTVRSGAVGLAALFLVVPAFVVLIVALAVSIIGIPLLLIAVPLYPLAVAAAAMFGLLAAAYAIGERTAEEKKLYDLRHRNAYAYLGTGLVILFAPVLMGHLIGMTPFLGWVGGLVTFFAYAAIWVATTAGLGAVILSRAGTRRTFARTPFPPRDSILDEDPFLERSDV